MPLGAMLWEDQTKTIVRRTKDVSETGILAEVDFVGEARGSGRLAGMVARFQGTDTYKWNPAADVVISGTSENQLTFQNGEIVLFKAVGIANQINFPSTEALNVLSLFNFVDPHPNFAWLKNTLVLWEAYVDLRTQTATGWAYEWVSRKPGT
jgi:hypothetical protein